MFAGLSIYLMLSIGLRGGGELGSGHLLVAGPVSLARVKPLFGNLFQGALCLFLLEFGRVAALGTREFRTVGIRLAAFAIVAPVLHGALGVLAARAAGLSEGGAVILATLSASAAYIAAPAAICCKLLTCGVVPCGLL